MLQTLGFLFCLQDYRYKQNKLLLGTKIGELLEQMKLYYDQVITNHLNTEAQRSHYNLKRLIILFLFLQGDFLPLLSSQQQRMEWK